MPTDSMQLKNVEDVSNFFKTLKILPEEIFTIEKSIHDKNIDPEKLFSIPEESILERLGVTHLHESWGKLFYELIRNHKSIQKDREEAAGAAERAEEAKTKMFNEDGDNARQTIFKLQSELYVKYVEMLTSNKKYELTKELDAIISVAKKEEKRLGEEVIGTCLKKYKTLRQRWAFIQKIQIPKKQMKNRQPNICTDFNDNFLRSNIDEEGLEDRLKHFIIMSHFFHCLLKQQMESVIENVNGAKNPQELDLEYDQFVLPFNDDLHVDGNKRANLTIGPIKRIERAVVKAKEYGESLNTIFIFIY